MISPRADGSEEGTLSMKHELRVMLPQGKGSIISRCKG